ncbi:MAG: sulfatase-like hydrolase/transferase [Planctomycetota bacterium]
MKKPILNPFYLSLATVVLSLPTLAANKPNIVVITSDNLGYGDVGCFGSKVIQTPRLDQLAGEGVRLTDFYTASPTCSASRGALLTGRYPERTGLNYQLTSEQNLNGVGLPHTETILPAYLKEVGYATGAFGKWNIGWAVGSRPTDRGFDTFLGHASGNMDYYHHLYDGRLDTFRDTQNVRLHGYSTDLFADAAIEFMRRHRDEPFFVYLPFNAPHFPNARNKPNPDDPVVWQAPDEALALYGAAPDTTDEVVRYRAVVTWMDRAIGRVVDAIDRLGLRDDTLVVWYSDNGTFMIPNKGLRVATNAPLRDGGVTCYEGGIRVAAIVRWPGRVRPGTVCSEPLISLDILPLALAAAGAELPKDRIIDGRDPTATLVAGATSPHDALYFPFRKHSAMRQGRYKIVRSKPENEFALYDLREDIGETTDLSEQYPELRQKMIAKWERWFNDITH